MFVIPDDLPIALTPFTFLLGSWSGSGVVSYPVEGAATTEIEFFQRVEFTPLSTGKLEYRSIVSDSQGALITQEQGYWMLAQISTADQPGPGLLPGSGKPIIETRDDLELLRNVQ